MRHLVQSSRSRWRGGAITLASLLLVFLFAGSLASAAQPRKVVLIAGKKSHGPEGNGVHDYPWSVKLLKVLLERSNIRDQVRVEMHFDGWPKDERTLDDADTIMVVSDGRDGDKFEEAPHIASPERVGVMERQIKRGCGFITFHFSTFAPEQYREQMLRWSGGYFQWETNGKPQWYSAIKTIHSNVNLSAPEHAVARGVKPFWMREEFYYNLRFAATDPKLAPLLTVPELPGREPHGRWVAWAREREDGGRGFGTTCGHFYDNWKNDDFRKMILNAIAWTAKAEVPPSGVESTYVERDVITAELTANAANGIPPYAPGAAASSDALFAKENLVAWCIVPFDAKKRGPEERAEMLDRLGVKRLAYDYRAEHIPTFDAEVEAMKKRGIEFTAWWFPSGLNEEAKRILNVIERHKIHPQLWVMGGDGTPKDQAEQDALVEREVARIRPIAEAAQRLGCKVALYNHGGWFGEPENQVTIIEKLKDAGIHNVGIVYNFHHGHDHIARFREMWRKMQPHLLTVNLNGMIRGGDRRGKKILNLGEGDEELAMMRVIRDSGWRGPVGIIDHRTELDSEVALLGNLRGLEWLRKELVQPGSGGENPHGATRSKGGLVSGKFGKALDASSEQVTVPGRPEWRTTPITVEAWVKLRNASSFNVVVASDSKKSGEHWELYSYGGEGDFSVFLPGKGGEVRSGAKICDDQWHHVAMVLEKERVRLFVDGRIVKEKALPEMSRVPVPGDLGIGRTVEDGIGCNGLIDDVRISRGAREIKEAPKAPIARDDATIELWAFEEPMKTAAAAAEFDRAPLDPQARPLHTEQVNRDRIYDFYAKQARSYAAAAVKPEILPPYPGLDGGRFGHWGNQTEASWNNDRWNQMDVGTVQTGVLRIGGKSIARAVCVKLDGGAACFDPVTFTWGAAWSGGFVRFGTGRFGFLGGIEPAGKAVPLQAPPQQLRGARYLGFVRNGAETTFRYENDGVEWLEAARFENGQVMISRERADAGNFARKIRGGAAQWPQTFVTKGVLGAEAPYAIDTLPLPQATPWKSLWHIGGHDFLPNGDIAVCTFEGEVWVVSGVDSDLRQLTWRKVAGGLHQPLGLLVLDGKICVTGRDQITRLHDLNGDGEMDFYECLHNAFTTPTGGHDYVTGLERDQEGRLYFTSGTQGVMRTSADLKTMEVLATGFRNPNGLGLGPNGEVAVAVQEGDWTPASMVSEFIPRKGEPGHYGYPGPKPGPRGHLRPLAYLPRGEDHSSGGQVYVQGNRWGVPAGTLVHFSWGNGTTFLVLREGHDDDAQGTAIPMPGDFRSGAHRGRFSPRDGQLYVTGMTGWITYTPDDGCLQRMRYTGGVVQVPHATELKENGVLLRFAGPLDRTAAGDVSRYFAQQWNYRYGAGYGSDEFSVLQPGRKGHDPLAITSANVLADGRSVFLEIPQIQPSNVVHLHCDVPGLLARDYYFTAHWLGAPFTGFPGYRPIAKKGVEPHSSHHHAHSSAPIAASRPVKWLEGAPGRPLLIEAASGLQFAQKELRAKRGERITLTFNNPDAMPHNWVLVEPGSVERVGGLANKLITEPDAVARHYVPDSPHVLCYTPILDPQKKVSIHFNVPAKPGRYPYMCTFPGHWMLMRGELIVE